MNDSQTIQLIHKVSAVLARESDQILMERFGLGLAQYKVLLSLQQKSKNQQKLIAFELGQTEASISRQVKLLTLSGYVAALKNPRNLRENHIRLTIKGQRLMEAAEVALANYSSRALAGLPLKLKQQLGEGLLLIKP